MYESGSGSAVELVVPWAGKLLQWLKDQGHTSLHHIAFQVPDIREKMKELKTRRVPLIDDEPTLGVEGLLVNFVYPPYMGIMVEIVEVPS
jgi:catechol 2,3-dioxygenase-like lactoylglutathione lyase family enzyme